MKLGLPALVLIATGCLSSSGALCQDAWQEELSYEISLVYDCDVAFLSQVVERTVDDKQVVMAKVHCTDRRNFDAQRLDPYEPFLFTECEEHDKSSC